MHHFWGGAARLFKIGTDEDPVVEIEASKTCQNFFSIKTAAGKSYPITFADQYFSERVGLQRDQEISQKEFWGLLLAHKNDL